MINFKDLKINPQISLSNFTTLRIGGPAELLAEPKNIDELKILISWAKEKNITCTIIGAGSNLLINDCGVKGLSICTRKLHGSSINKLTGKVMALSGESLPSIARRAANAGLKGLEWAIGIPGTVGGAVVMNAGAQDGCIAERIISATVIDLKRNKTFVLNNKELDFSYRDSILQRKKYIVLSANFQLDPGYEPKEINFTTNENLNKRKQTQPYHLPTCGSVFTNPEPFKAGILIENLGLKGKCYGGAKISELHANFIVNNSNASSSDIHHLIKLIQKKVEENHGFLLHTEVKQLGFERNV